VLPLFPKLLYLIKSVKVLPLFPKLLYLIKSPHMVLKKRAFKYSYIKLDDIPL